MAVGGANAGYDRTTSLPPSGRQRPDGSQAGEVNGLQLRRQPVFLRHLSTVDHALKAVHPGRFASVGQRLVRFQSGPWLNLSVLYSFAKG